MEFGILVGEWRHGKEKANDYRCLAVCDITRPTAAPLEKMRTGQF